MAGGFAAQPTFLPIYFEMKDRGIERLKKSMMYSYGFSFFLYLSVAYFGYFTFPQSVQPNLLSSDYGKNKAMLAAMILLSLYVISDVPLFAHAFRKSLAELLLSAARSRSLGALKVPAEVRRSYVEMDREAVGPESKKTEIDNATNNNRANVETAKNEDAKVEMAAVVHEREKEHALHGQLSLEQNPTAPKEKVAESQPPTSTALQSARTPKSFFANMSFQLPERQHIIVTLSFVLSAAGVALVADNIGQVNALMGSTTLPICFVLFILYLYLHICVYTTLLSQMVPSGGSSQAASFFLLRSFGGPTHYHCLNDGSPQSWVCFLASAPFYNYTRKSQAGPDRSRKT
ncbi:hypothetical protein RFI_07571 [Reticulomyxa filosa]|uniref:Amino acid transporter transmembrane domain-containing protein n=1 Tax=Reticulomyxa filosa TaxID=46433 RepID=X6NTE6_RETFI|nr:hypothetical protein RFI_07571 [Reticulomyxa filosa]|eukprot:ETO29550.1 hypothetical protein RFI_07571 [Reticulomyxa filosa]